MPNDILFKLAQKDLRVPLRLPFPYSLTHNFLYHPPALLIRPALGDVKNPGFITDNYDKLKISVKSPSRILSVRTENLSHLTFNEMEVGPFLVPFGYEIFRVARKPEQIKVEAGLGSRNMAVIHANLIYDMFKTGIAETVSSPIDGSRTYERVRRKAWKIGSKALKPLDVEFHKFRTEKQRLEDTIIACVERSIPNIAQKVNQNETVSRAFFKKYDQEYGFETMDQYIQSLF